MVCLLYKRTSEPRNVRASAGTTAALKEPKQAAIISYIATARRGLPQEELSPPHLLPHPFSPFSCRHPVPFTLLPFTSTTPPANEGSDDIRDGTKDEAGPANKTKSARGAFGFGIWNDLKMPREGCITEEAEEAEQSIFSLLEFQKIQKKKKKKKMAKATQRKTTNNPNSNTMTMADGDNPWESQELTVSGRLIFIRFG